MSNKAMDTEMTSTILDYRTELRVIRERLSAGEISVEAARVLVADLKVAAKFVDIEYAHATATGRLVQGSAALPTVRLGEHAVNAARPAVPPVDKSKSGGNHKGARS